MLEYLALVITGHLPAHFDSLIIFVSKLEVILKNLIFTLFFN